MFWASIKKPPFLHKGLEDSWTHAPFKLLHQIGEQRHGIKKDTDISQMDKEILQLFLIGK